MRASEREIDRKTRNRDAYEFGETLIELIGSKLIGSHNGRGRKTRNEDSARAKVKPGVLCANRARREKTRRCMVVYERTTALLVNENRSSDDEKRDSGATPR